MPSAVAEAEAAAMDNAVDVWRLITASRLQGPVWQWSWPVSRMGDGGLQRSRAMICRSSPHEAGGGTRQELTIKAKMPFVSSSADERKMDF